MRPRKRIAATWICQYNCSLYTGCLSTWGAHLFWKFNPHLICIAEKPHPHATFWCFDKQIYSYWHIKKETQSYLSTKECHSATLSEHMEKNGTLTWLSLDHDIEAISTNDFSNSYGISKPPAKARLGSVLFRRTQQLGRSAIRPVHTIAISLRLTSPLKQIFIRLLVDIYVCMHSA